MNIPNLSTICEEAEVRGLTRLEWLSELSNTIDYARENWGYRPAAAIPLGPPLPDYLKRREHYSESVLMSHCIAIRLWIDNERSRSLSVFLEAVLSEFGLPNVEAFW